MNKLKNDTKKSGQRKQKQEYESPSESKETDSFTGDQESSSTSENARQYHHHKNNQQKYHKKSLSSSTSATGTATAGTVSASAAGTATATATSSSSSSSSSSSAASLSFNQKIDNSTAGITATQFSVQRSDVDGLRMKISAIRSTKPQISNPPSFFSSSSASASVSASGPVSMNTTNPNYSEKIIHNNNNTITSNLEPQYMQKSAKVKGSSSSSSSNNNSSKSKEQTKNLQSFPKGFLKNLNHNHHHHHNNNHHHQHHNQNQQKQTQYQQTTKQQQQQQQQPQPHLTTDPFKSAVSAAVGSSVAAETMSNAKKTFGHAANRSSTSTSTSISTATSAINPASLLNNISSKLASAKTFTSSCLSDATESGCSEATTTTTTILTTNEKASSKKIKVKRKKCSSKQSSSSKKYKKPRTTQQQLLFSSDSEDDEPLASQQQQSQRAPRLLITNINTKAGGCSSSSALALKGLAVNASNGSTSASVNNHNALNESDNIGLSSSDNDIPNLVNAAIKCVESDTDDTIGDAKLRRNNKSKNLPQYQSTLLQDFMEITQMIGENASDLNTSSPSKLMRSESIANLALHCQTESLSATNLSSNTCALSNVKKKRGRPKKILDSIMPLETNFKGRVLPINSSNINESADSGVISTTSTTQSTTPSPRIPSAATPTKPRNPDHHHLRTQVSPAKSTVGLELSGSMSQAKPKIDIAYLDKRMYATERVLYPPPRNKRRQSQKLGSSSTSLAGGGLKKNKDELKLDPVWKKIDVNKKFRRPSLSGYKSDGGNTTICSKILAAKSGYVSDYGSFHPKSSRRHHSSGYKSDASCKSRYSVRSCASRRSRAKSCGYKSDCKDSGATLKSSSKFRRKRRSSMSMRSHGRAGVDLSDDQDILQLACLSLGQSSEESNEYVCKPNLAALPTTSASKKYGEINRFIATGEYFGRGSGAGAGNYSSQVKSFYELGNEEASQDGFNIANRLNKKTLQQKDAEAGADLLPHVNLKKIKSRRSSVASCCSSFYSGTSKVRRRHRRKSFRFPNTTTGKNSTIDSKLLTDIEIITSTFSTLCSLHNLGGSSTNSGASALNAHHGLASQRLNANSLNTSALTGKEKLIAESNKLQQSLSLSALTSLNTSSSSAATAAANGTTTMPNKMKDKRIVKKRKTVDSLVDFAMLSAQSSGAGGGGGGGASGGGGSSKRRHKKANSSSPDDHKLPLKKRHYLLTPGEKPIEATLSLSARMYANSTEAWAAAAAVAKSTASTKSQQHFHAQKSVKQGLTPKKRHFLHNASGLASHLLDESPTSNKHNKSNNSSPLRIMVDTSNSISGGKLLDISPISLSSLKHHPEVKKRTRLEGVLAKVPHERSEKEPPTRYPTKIVPSAPPQTDPETSCPPPGVFEPTVELEIQIAPISKLSETAASIITKSEVDSPLLGLDLAANNGGKADGPRVVEALLNKTGGNLILKRKRKKINRTGFPTVKRKKRKVIETPNAETAVAATATATAVKATAAATATAKTTPAVVKTTNKQKQQQQLQQQQQSQAATTKAQEVAKSVNAMANAQMLCDRVPRTGEASETFLERANRTPRLSVVALERLQGSPSSSVHSAASSRTHTEKSAGKQKSSRKRRTTKESGDSAESEKGKTKKSDAIGTETATDSATATATTTAANDESIRSSSKKKSDHLDGGNVKPIKVRRGNGKMNKQASAGRPSKAQVLTAKALESKVKLPAGLDPNTNFSCKIRLKRRNSVHPSSSLNADERKRCESPTPESVEAEATAKESDEMPNEHDILPWEEALSLDEAFRSDSSDEKSLAAFANNLLKNPGRFRKNYLPAGLFSDFFKVDPSPKVNKKSMEKSEASVALEEWTPNKPLLPPPPYCEKYLRRTQMDFELPYDIWWAYTNSKLPGRNTVPSWNYKKIRTNIYADSVRPNTAGIDHPICNCKVDVGCGDNCLNRMVYTECSPSNCPSQENCHNQKIQKHDVAPGVERFMTEDKGWGVRTKLPIQKGTYILEYVGEVVTEREFKDRMGSIYRNDTHHYCLHLDGGLVIDGHRMGSDGRFVNHSCEPNCEMQKWSVNGLSRMALFAKRSIESGEELTYDYNFALFNPAEGQPCRCKASQCRGVIGGKSQRVKPLPVEKPVDTVQKDGRCKRQRKRKASKNAQRLSTKEVVLARVQQLSDREKKIVKQSKVFMFRTYEKIRRCKAKKMENANNNSKSKQVTPTPSPVPSGGTAERRPSTPSSLAVQISALCSSRNMKTRGLSLAVQDPEVERMAKMAVVLKTICSNLEGFKDPEDSTKTIGDVFLNNNNNNNNGSSANKKKKLSNKPGQKNGSGSGGGGVGGVHINDLKTLLTHIEQGFYKEPLEFDTDMKKLFLELRSLYNEEAGKMQALDALEEEYEKQKSQHYEQLVELLPDEVMLKGFCTKPPNNDKTTDAEIVVNGSSTTADENQQNQETKSSAPATPTAPANGEEDNNDLEKNKTESQAEVVQNKETTSAEGGGETEKELSLIQNETEAENAKQQEQGESQPEAGKAIAKTPPPLNVLSEDMFAPLPADSSEDIIRCICGLFRDEGLMIQCSKCTVWQHTECTKADINAENYLCERCEPREVDREIPIDEFTEDGHQYYLSLMRGKLQVRQGDAVYVLRDIPIKDSDGKEIKKHTYETIGNIDYNECDIFRVERLWKSDTGKRFIFGHHFLRPHETFHEPSRRFYPNEVVRVPLYEVVPIELVIGRCWVLDRTTFCKGRPIECVAEDHCYICELRVDKSARFFSKAKTNYPSCTKSYAFRKFAEKLRISKSYAPHNIDPAFLKNKKQRQNNENSATSSTTSTGAASATAGTSSSSISSQGKQKQNQNQQGNQRKRNNTNNNNNSSSTTTSNNNNYSSCNNSTSSSPIVQLNEVKCLTPTLTQPTKDKRLNLESYIKTITLKKLEIDPSLTIEPPEDATYLLSGRGARQRKTLQSNSNAASPALSTA